MRLVFFTRHTPWHDREGTNVRNAGLLRGLKARAELHVVFIPSATEAITPPPASLPYTLHHIPYNPAQRTAARQLAQTLAPDVIWHSWKFSIRAVGALPQIPAVLDMVDVLWLNVARVAARRRGVKKLRATLNSLYHRYQDNAAARMANVVVLVNPDERTFLHTTRPVLTLPNGFTFGAQCPPYHPSASRLVMLGNFRTSANRDGADWFYEAVWSRLRARFPQARLELIGLGSDRLRLASADGVTAHGYVADPEPYFENAAAILCPILSGTGTRTKILYAWARGVPVVCTTNRAHGLDARDGDTLLLADDAETFASACTRLLDDSALGARLADHAFAHGKANYDWDKLYPRLDEILDAAIRSQRMRR